jgi:polyphosphate glucokinase
VAQAFGLDIGGTGIKGAVVDVESGELAGERVRMLTPQPSTPEAVAQVAVEVVRSVGWDGPIGATFPAVIVDGVARTAANVDKSWIGTDVAEVLGAAVGSPAVVLNDADAAGLAEINHGAARDEPGTVLVLTLGTGIGSALFRDGLLVPNTEFGHVELDGHVAERRASEQAKERHDWSWEEWAERLQHYLRHIDRLLSPRLVVLGGGASKKADKWLPQIDVRPELRPAALRNVAGIVGAAMAVQQRRDVPAEPVHGTAGGRSRA